jgi:hypothetical protein
VVAELARDPKTLAAAEMHVDRGCREDVEQNKLRREKLSQHNRYL